MTHCKCKNCGHNHHCDQECEDCNNDVCIICDCNCCSDNIVYNKSQDEWAWQDSGVEQGI